jgi:hypothetical protein
MRCIYEVRYEVQWRTSEPSQWEPQTVKVCAGPDAQEAVDRAREAALAQARLDENGKEERCTAFRLREVALLAQADL